MVMKRSVPTDPQRELLHHDAHQLISHKGNPASVRDCFQPSFSLHQPNGYIYLKHIYEELLNLFEFSLSILELICILLDYLHF